MQINANNINLTTKISFKESVLGVEKELSYRKNIKCDGCDGKGKEAQSNGCSNCNGFGRIIQQQGNTMFTTGCNKCNGRNVKFKDCLKCKCKGVVDSNVNVKINIPPGHSATFNNTRCR